MYEEASKQQAPHDDPSAESDEPAEDKQNKKDDDVIDAEFEVKE